jgi:Zn-finger nucleic acid-binding protein
MNVPESAFCSGCGRQLGLEPVGEAGNLPCPICKQAMQLYRDDAGVLFDCNTCGGQFVEHPLFREMLHRHDPVPVPDGVITLARRPDGRSNYIPCPECAALMNRKNFGGTSGVVVDVCKKHGTWFDEGELPRVLAFVAGGGLDRAKQRDADEAVRLRHDAAAASARGEAFASSHEARLSWSGGTTRAETVVGLFLELLR